MDSLIDFLTNIELRSGIASNIAGFFLRLLMKFFRPTQLNVSKDKSIDAVSNCSNMNNIIVENGRTSISITQNHSNSENEDLKEMRFSQEREIALRLEKVLNEINSSLREENKLSILDIAKLTGYTSSFESVQSYFNGNECQPFGFLESYSKLFGVNKKWLESGIGPEYFVDLVTFPSEIEKIIEERKPRRVYFILCDSERKEAAIILKEGDYKYTLVGSSDWPMALYNSNNQPNVGSTGQANIIRFFKILERVHNNKQNFQSHLAESLVVSSDLWEPLFAGKIYPGKIVYERRSQVSYWSEDILDLNIIDNEKAKEYIKVYGEWFNKTRSFLKARLDSVKGLI